MINRLVFYIVKQTRWESKGIVKMSIDELISIIVEPLLAFIGLVITFLQLKDDRRGKKIEESMIQKEEEERLIIADLVKHSDSYLELLNKFSEQINFINSKAECIFRKNRALAPHERSAVPLGTDHCPVC